MECAKLVAKRLASDGGGDPSLDPHSRLDCLMLRAAASRKEPLPLRESDPPFLFLPLLPLLLFEFGFPSSSARRVLAISLRNLALLRTLLRCYSYS